MSPVAYPLAGGHWHIHGDQLLCQLPRRTLAVTAPGELLGALHRLCDGSRPWQEVTAELGQQWASGTVASFLRGLAGERVLVEGVGQSRTFADHPVPSGVLGHIAHPGWLVLVLRHLAAPALQPGVYRVARGHSLCPVPGRFEEAWNLLADPRLLCFASALLIAPQTGAACDTALRRALRGAITRGLAGALCDDLRADAFPSWAPHAPLHACLVVGARPNASELVSEQTHRWPAVRAIAAPPVTPLEQRAAFLAGPVRVGGQDIYGTGRASEPRQAARKAEAEAWERLAWASLGSVVQAPWREVAGAVDPRLVAAYTPAQHAQAGFPFAAFAKRRAYAWRLGVDANSGASVALPAECIHALTALPEGLAQRACTSTSTSGMAAWTDAEGALCRATLELIERDAFLRGWLAGRPLPTVAPNSLPLPARRRVAALAQAGLRVAVLHLETELAAVACVFVQGQRTPFTAVTAAAEFDAEQALARALDEAEARATNALAHPARPLISTTAIQGPDEINRYYQTRRFYRRADFLGAGHATVPFGRGTTGCTNWAELKAALVARGLRLLAFDLTPAGAAVDQGRVPLRVMRAVVPGFLPIWFQPGLEPAGLASFPRGARSRSLAIHPFT